MTMADNLTATGILQTMRDEVAKLDRMTAGARNTLSSHGWVITSHGMPVKLEIDAGNRITGVHVTGWAGVYSRLTRDDAQRLAPTIRDGADRHTGEALPLVVALERSCAQAVAALSWAEHSVAELEAATGE